ETLFKNGAVYQYRSEDNKLKSAIIFRLGEERINDITKILFYFERKKFNFKHMETRKNKNEFELYIELENLDCREWTHIRAMLETLIHVDIYPRATTAKDKTEEPTNDIPEMEDVAWFPKSIGDLDNFQNVLMYGTDLDADHPGFLDMRYRKRRKLFSEIAMLYKQGRNIPKIRYTDEEIRTWGSIYTHLEEMYYHYASEKFVKNFKELQVHCNYSRNCIPQLQDVSNYLKRKTGFTLRPVAGYLSPRDFLSGLAFRVFHCTQYIRHSSDPYYTPEPDCCHELLGHMPMLADSEFAQFSQEIGLASLGCSEGDIKKLAACYFFTVEFGLCVEDGFLKAYGAGLLSSGAELAHVMNGIRNNSVTVDMFEVEKACQTQCMVTSYQKRYFITNSFQDALAALRQFASSIERPFSVEYDPYTQRVLVLDIEGKENRDENEKQAKTKKILDRYEEDQDQEE
ncbi:hypothetical protein TCAL_00938, partial [Tigriopus californicus]